MATRPLNHLVLAAGSVADDLSYVALADISRLLGTTTDYRVIGGLMVTALAYRWNLGSKPAWRHMEHSLLMAEFTYRN